MGLQFFLLLAGGVDLIRLVSLFLNVMVLYHMMKSFQLSVEFTLVM